jgi:uncharacterized protein
MSSVKISVNRLFGSDVGALDVDQSVRPAGELKERYPNGVRVRAQIRGISHGVYLEGTLEGREHEMCARCLEAFSRNVSVPLLETYSEDVPESDALFSDVTPLLNREIDLGELVTQLLEVDEPIAAVCDERCRGICHICGGNRNVTVCACSEATIDPRLAGLARLLEERGTD